MCLGIPYEVVAVADQESCVIRVGSGERHCFTGLVSDVQKGDWLLVHAGMAIEKIEPEDAQTNLRLIHQYITGEELR